MTDIHVVKIGGSSGICDQQLLDELAERVQSGERWVVVHGGSSEMNELSEKLGVAPRFVTSVSGFESRFTDDRTMEIFTMTYCGRRNKALVEGFQKRSINAIGCSGADARLVLAEKKGAIKVIEDGKKKLLRGDRSGTICSVNGKLLRQFLDGGLLPVICPPAIDRTTGEMLNVDGDRLAAVLAATLGASRLVILSNVPGLLRDLEKGKRDPDNLVSEIDLSEVSDPYFFAKGRMKKKVMGAIEAIQQGVARVIFSDANCDRPLEAALSGAGTHIFNGESQDVACASNFS